MLNATCLAVLQLHKDNTSLSWGLVTFTVQKPADLDAMRSALGSQVAFFEADLTGFTTTRALRQAASSRQEHNIPFQSPFPVDDPVQAAKRPCWADDSCGGDWFTDARAEVHDSDKPTATTPGTLDSAEYSGKTQSVASWG